MEQSPSTPRTRTRSAWRRRARPPQELSCFIASHISTVTRVEELARTFRSILAQEPRPPSVAISWSAEAEVAPLVRRVLDHASASGLHLEQLHSATRQSQFDHLRRLTALFASRPPSRWVFFSDDDDIWSERRYSIYLEKCMDVSAPCRAVLCRRKAVVFRLDQKRDPQEPSAVRALLQEGCLRLADSNEKVARAPLLAFLVANGTHV